MWNNTVVKKITSNLSAVVTATVFAQLAPGLAIGFSDLTPNQQSDYTQSQGFDSDPAWSRLQTTPTFNAIVAGMIANNGGTFKAKVLRHNDSVEATPVHHDTGYYVSLKGYEKSLYRNHELNHTDVLKYVLNVSAVMPDNAYLGTWRDTFNNQWYLDCSVWVPDLLTALILAHENSQIAIWDCGTGKSITLDNVPVVPTQSTATPKPSAKRYAETA